MARLCNVNESSPMLQARSAWMHAEWDNENKTFDIGELTNRSAPVVWASAFPHLPFIIGKCCGTDEFSLAGNFVDTLRQICLKLFLRCKIRHAGFGTSANDSLNGVLGDITAGRADVGISAYSINAERANMFDITPSSFTRDYEVVIHESNTYLDTSTPLLTAFVELFSPTVWIIIVVIFVIFTMLLAMADVVQGKMADSPVGPSFADGMKRWSLDLLGSAIATYDIEIRLQFVTKAHVFLVAVWLCWTIMVYFLFTSRLPSILSTGHLKQVPFDTMEGLAESGYTVYGTPYIKSLLESHEKPSHRQVGTDLVALAYVDPAQYNQYIVNLLESGKQVAVIISSDAHNEMAEISCGLVIVIKNLASSLISGLIFPKNSPLRSSFAIEHASMYQQGMLSANYKFYQKFTMDTRTRNCVPRLFTTKIESAFSHLSVGDIYFIIIIWLCGLGGATLLASTEILFHRLGLLFQRFLNSYVLRFPQ
ncbi:hypothetical protein BV898_01798 [Hypsibius exemplaris]|uniref:Uncharacterized protein n=1 Tax=Hypsibius exemplaris TaxID=2072580 RepID=A0A1W0XA24_HYPEX|nr:hypothetical protein BV898_01798 [Hypsibius exemplaris]